MILLLTIWTTIPQIRLRPYYVKDKEYHPEKNVRERCTILYTAYDIVQVMIYNRYYKAIVLIISVNGSSC